MLFDITLGQFFPGSTIIHKLDPRTKLIITFVYITALFLAKNVISYAVVLFFLTISVALSKIKLKTILGGIKPIIIIISMATILNIFFTQGEIIARLGFLKVTREGVYSACFMIARLVMLITGTLLLTYTTSPVALTDAIELLLNPLKKVKFPVHELAMMMSIALRFIPTLIDETDKIICAQKARGADFDTGGLIKRARAVLPLIIPLFISAFRRSDELAAAMESRCYHGGEGRGRMKVLTLSTRDYMALLYSAALLISVIVLGSQGL